MRTYSSTKPIEEIKLEIDSNKEYCDVLFFVNIEEETRENKTLSKYVMLDKYGNLIEDNIAIQKAMALSKSEIVIQNEYIVKPIYTYTNDTIYAYDYYRYRRVKYREGLLDTIQQHKTEWIAKAKLLELKEESNNDTNNIDLVELKKSVDDINDILQDILLSLIPLDPTL